MSLEGLAELVQAAVALQATIREPRWRLEDRQWRDEDRKWRKDDVKWRLQDLAHMCAVVLASDTTPGSQSGTFAAVHCCHTLLTSRSWLAAHMHHVALTFGKPSQTVLWFNA